MRGAVPSLPVKSDTPSPSRFRRPIRIAVGLSILAHALLLAIPLHRHLESPGMPVPPFKGPLNVTLAEPEPEKPEVPPPPVPEPERRILTRLKPVVPSESPSSEAPAFTVPEPEPPPVREPQFNMMAVIAANRERRRASEAAAARMPAGGAEPSGDAVALANINRNLQTLSSDSGEGTGGVFQILHKGVRTAEFSFNGWTTESRRHWREVIEVDAGPQGDVERAIVRRMIELIRTHYSGDFNWESQRLGRVVVLSAAPADNDYLEAYLLREFFGTPLLKRAR